MLTDSKVKRLIISILLSLCISPLSFGQTLHYDVIRGGKSMGSTVVKREMIGTKTIHHQNTKTQFRLLLSFEVEYDLKETFANGELISGKGFNTLNGTDQKRTDMSKEGDKYSLVIDGIRTVIDEKSIRDSVSEIYFEEPHDGKRVFSAYFGRYLVFIKTGDKTYSLTSPDGTNVYKYENGICTRVDVSRDFANFHFELKPESLAAVRNNKILANKND